MRHYQHKITNFTPKASIFHKIMANIIFAVSIIKYKRRKNYLTEKDYRRSKKFIRLGDLILVGNHRQVSSVFIGGIFTHAILYAGKNSIIHTTGDGVEKISYKDLFDEYDTLLIMRPKKIDSKKAKLAIEFAKKQIDKPFNFELATLSPKDDQERFFCTQLVHASYQFANIDIDIKSSINNSGIMALPMRPNKFINNKFDIVYVSKSIRKHVHGRFTLNNKIYRERLLKYILNF